MNIQKYLRRIGYTGKTEVTSEALFLLQKYHLLHVPFENLDIHNGIKIEIENSYSKIVEHNRGGFCYELNGAFYHLLKALGFDVRTISASVYDGKGGFGPDVDHLALIVHFPSEDYLVDVGFGDFSLHPLKINSEDPQSDPHGIFRIRPYNGNFRIAERKNSSAEWEPEYIFSTQTRSLNDFREMCTYHQTSSESRFTQKQVCTLPVANGRITLTNNKLKSTVNGIVTERNVEESEIKELLKNYFGISVSKQERHPESITNSL
jgi:N-hydroxyarylamine O-acetyltransferase